VGNDGVELTWTARVFEVPEQGRRRTSDRQFLICQTGGEASTEERLGMCRGSVDTTMDRDEAAVANEPFQLECRDTMVDEGFSVDDAVVIGEIFVERGTDE
jgi:hypothetical protein